MPVNGFHGRQASLFPLPNNTTVALAQRDTEFRGESCFIFLRVSLDSIIVDGRGIVRDVVDIRFKHSGIESAREGPVARGVLDLDHSPGAPKIVIADDNAQNVELLEAYLGDFDCEIRTARDGEETIDVVKEFAPDLLLLDVMMPRLSGFEVCKLLRADPETQDLLILMVTALNEAADFERGVQAGTDDFLTKPVNKIELLCRIRSLLRVRHLRSQLDRTLAYLAEFETASRASNLSP